MTEIRQLTTYAQKESFRAMLLDADPCWEMVLNYLDGDMYVLYYNGQPAAEAVVFSREDFGMHELKNVSVLPHFRRRGLASATAQPFTVAVQRTGTSHVRRHQHRQRWGVAGYISPVASLPGL